MPERTITETFNTSTPGSVPTVTVETPEWIELENVLAYSSPAKTGCSVGADPDSSSSGIISGEFYGIADPYGPYDTLFEWWENLYKDQGFPVYEDFRDLAITLYGSEEAAVEALNSTPVGEVVPFPILSATCWIYVDYHDTFVGGGISTALGAAMDGVEDGEYYSYGIQLADKGFVNNPSDPWRAEVVFSGGIPLGEIEEIETGVELTEGTWYRAEFVHRNATITLNWYDSDGTTLMATHSWETSDSAYVASSHTFVDLAFGAGSVQSTTQVWADDFTWVIQDEEEQPQIEGRPEDVRRIFT